MKPNKKSDSLLARFYNKCTSENNKQENDHDDDEDSSSDEDFECDLDEEEDNSSESISDESDQETDCSTSSQESDKTIIKKEKIDSTISAENKPNKIEQKIGNDKVKLMLNNGQANKSKMTKNNQLTDNLNKPTTNAKSITQHDVCCVCLNKQSDGSNELVSCDSCGFCTHEGCYGIADTDSKQSSNSSASTEPWFCNSCLFREKLEPKKTNGNETNYLPERQCELCPNVECGLMKQTDNGKFVHIQCALYTPGVAFHDTDKLWPVVLDEISSNRWGEQACSLCDDVTYSRTGVCIKCDAGLCKTYFHVTCAQKHGYLTDPLQMSSTDPFIAYCKQHNEKAHIKNRKTNYAMMMSNYKAVKSNNQRLFETDPDRERLSRKFQKAVENYQLNRDKLIKPYVSSTKTSRMLTTCPSALKSLIKKSNLSTTQNNNFNFENEMFRAHASSSSVSFTVSFVKHYFEREQKILQYHKDIEELKQTQAKLTKEEIDLTNKYDTKSEEHKKAADKNSKLKASLNTYTNLFDLLAKKSELPASLQTFLASCDKNNHEPAKSKKESKKKLDHSISPSDHIKKQKKSDSVLNLDAICCECNQKTNAHLLIDCDTCKKYYHITCLEPPLTSVPKKTKLYGWECSKCVHQKDKSSSECEMDETKSANDSISSTTVRTSRRERKPKQIDDYSLTITLASLNSTKKKTPKKGRKSLSSNKATPSPPKPQKDLVEKINKKRNRKIKSESELRVDKKDQTFGSSLLKFEELSPNKPSNDAQNNSCKLASSAEAIYIQDE